MYQEHRAEVCKPFPGDLVFMGLRAGLASLCAVTEDAGGLERRESSAVFS